MYFLSIKPQDKVILVIPYPTPQNIRQEKAEILKNGRCSIFFSLFCVLALSSVSEAVGNKTSL